VASFSEYGGTIVNVDNVLQQFAPAVRKNDLPKDIVEITRLLGGAVKDDEQAWPGMKVQVKELADVDPNRIPEQGLQLISDSEEAHVTT
jgi:NADH-quinone oxidoreductase subunit G